MATSHNSKCVAHSDMTGKSLVDKYLPKFFLPYAHLARWDRPIGTWLVLLPALWGLFLANRQNSNNIFNIELLQIVIIFTLGAFLIRGAGCTVNDIWDRDIDTKVERTKKRPLASGSMSIKSAILFAALQFILGFLLLLQLNKLTILLGVLSVIPICIYPLMKRITWWPQLVLGIVFNWGVLMGWSAVRESIELPAILLYLSAVFWTLGYDTIYAHQDKEDDDRLGIKSTALLFGKNSYIWVAVFYFLMISLLAISIYLVKTSLLSLLLVLLPAGHLLWQLLKLDIDSQDSCLYMFKTNKFTGLLVLLSILI